MENLNMHKPSPFREELGVTEVQSHVSDILVCDINSFKVIVFSEGKFVNETEGEITVGVKKYSKYFNNIEDALRCKTELRIDDTWKEEYTVDRIDFIEERGGDKEYEDLDDYEKFINCGFGIGFDRCEEKYLDYLVTEDLL